MGWLHRAPGRRDLMEHPFFDAVEDLVLTREHVGIILGQWWHPLHYFPTFLAGCCAVLADISSKCAVARILYQETGEGDPRLAHEAIYRNTMQEAGFDCQTIEASPAFPATAALLDCYRTSSTDPHRAVGAIYATEVADLRMVAAIGIAVRRATSATALPWVDIHVKQEPGHVRDAGVVALPAFTEAHQRRVRDAASEMWRHWISFFDSLHAAVASPRPA